MRVHEWLAHARGLGVDRLDAQLLLAWHCRRPRSWLLAHGDDEIDAAALAAALPALARRADGVPLAYLVGEKEFHGMAYTVTPDVLVPRPETELLADWALERLDPSAAAHVADLGTGSGALAVTLAHRRPRAEVTATDASPAALAVARANAQRHGVRVEFRPGHWWHALAAGERYDLVVANPPYLGQADPHLAALQHEPALALVAGPDGLEALREIVAGARSHLQPTGWLLLEHGHDQGPAVRELMARAGFTQPTTRCDLAGLERCTGAVAPG